MVKHMKWHFQNLNNYEIWYLSIYADYLAQ